MEISPGKPQPTIEKCKGVGGNSRRTGLIRLNLHRWKAASLRSEVVTTSVVITVIISMIVVITMVVIVVVIVVMIVALDR